jgi:hypothetical protein
MVFSDRSYYSLNHRDISNRDCDGRIDHLLTGRSGQVAVPIDLLNGNLVIFFSIFIVIILAEVW